MSIKKIEDLIDSLPKRKPELCTEVNANDHFELARLLHQLSPEGKIHVFNNLNKENSQSNGGQRCCRHQRSHKL